MLGRHTFAAVTFAVALALVSVGTTPAAPSATLASGRTSVSLSAELLGALGTLGVTPGTVKPGKLNGTTVSFPISGGVVDLATARGEIQHTGGLTLTAGATEVRLLNFTIDTAGATPKLTGAVVVNGSYVGRLTLFDLALPELALPIQPSGNRVTIPNVAVTLSAEAAGALNEVFGVSAFAEGIPVGTATVNLRAGTPKSGNRVANAAVLQ